MARSSEEREGAAGAPKDSVSQTQPISHISASPHLRKRRSHVNLALLQQYGSNAWRIHNYLNEATAQNIEKALEDLKNLTTEVNRDRKNYQVSVMWWDRRAHPTYRRLCTDAAWDAADFSGDTLDGVNIEHPPD